MPMTGYDIEGHRIECRATTRRGTPCQRTPLPQQRLLPVAPAPGRAGRAVAVAAVVRPLASAAPTGGDAAWSRFIGLGIMGSRQAANLRACRLRADRLQPHPRAGRARGPPSTAATSPTARARSAERSDVVITMVVDGAAGRGDAARRGRRRRRRATGHAVRRHVDDRAGRRAPDRRGAAPSAATRFVDAPVTGSSPKAEDGTLTIMAGGSDEDIERAMPLLEAMGEIIVHVGGVGTGQQVKVISNAVSAVNCATLAQALVVGRQADVNLEALLEVMGARLGQLDDAAAQGRADAQARLHAAVQARPHAQGRPAVPRRGARRRRGASRSRRSPESSTRRESGRGLGRRRTSRPCWRSSRVWPTPVV